MLLLIDTSQETGTAALSRGAEVLFSEENKIAKEHASWLHMAIGRILSEAKITVRDLEAVAVVSGPGSYTGLRVGMAAAKGFCYALKIPLITQNTLRVMAESMIPLAAEKKALICPMIDARRDEVFTALYTLSPVNDQRSTVNDNLSTASCQPRIPRGRPPTPHSAGQAANQLVEIKIPQALILDKSAFESELASHPIIFFGSGAEKWEKLSDSPNAIFQSQPSLLQAFAKLTQSDFDTKTWADPVYTEPVYLKEFFSY